MNYRQRWYAERGLPYEPPKLGDMCGFRCLGGHGFVMPPLKEKKLRPAAKNWREPGEDSDRDVYGEAA